MRRALILLLLAGCIAPKPPVRYETPLEVSVALVDIRPGNVAMYYPESNVLVHTIFAGITIDL